MIAAAPRRGGVDRATAVRGVAILVIVWSLWYRWMIGGRFEDFADTVAGTACLVALDITTLAPRWLRIVFWTTAVLAAITPFLAAFA